MDEVDKLLDEIRKYEPPQRQKNDGPPRGVTPDSPKWEGRWHTVRTLFGLVKSRRNPDGSWQNAAASFAIRVRTGAEAGLWTADDMVREALDDRHLPFSFRKTLRSYVGGGDG